MPTSIYEKKIVCGRELALTLARVLKYYYLTIYILGMFIPIDECNEFELIRYRRDVKALALDLQIVVP